MDNDKAKLVREKLIEKRKQEQRETLAVEKLSEKLYNDVAKENIVRYEFYKDGYLKSIVILFSSIFLLICMLGSIYFTSVVYKAPNNYIPLDEEKRIYDPIPLDRDVMSEEALKQWIVEAMEDIMSYDYVTYGKHGAKVSKYFVEKGYQDYKAEFDNNSDLKRVIANSAIVVIPVITNPEPIGKPGTLQGTKYWRYKITMVKLFYSPKSGVLKNEVAYEVMVVRASRKDVSAGIGIYKISTLQNK